VRAALLHPDRLVYLPDAVDQATNDHLVRFLEGVPVVSATAHRPGAAFAFTSPIVDGTPVEGRREACAGWPVWDGGGPVRGVAIPEPLLDLAQEVQRALAALDDPGLGDPRSSLTFSSVYADRYPPGGTFFPHTDRSCYGSTIAGVNLGRGRCRIVFRCGEGVLAEAVLEPGSIYAFAGQLRAAPCTHEIVEVDAVRFGVTYRSPAPALVGTEGSPP
jgi:hypothetical protein